MCGDQRVSRIQNKRWFGISSGSPARSAVRARGQVRAPPPPSSSSPVLLFLLLLLHAPLADSLRLKGGIPSQITSNARIKFTHALSPSLFIPLPLTLLCLRSLPFKRAPNGSRTPAGRGVKREGLKKESPQTHHKQFGTSLNGSSYFWSPLHEARQRLMLRQPTERPGRQKEGNILRQPLYPAARPPAHASLAEGTYTSA